MATKEKLAIQLLLVAFTSLALASVVVNGAKTTNKHLRFYMHDTVTASAGSPSTVARLTTGTAPLPGDPTTRFGDMYAIDEPLTEEPGAASPAVGRAQGFYLFASRLDHALMLCVNMVFTAGAAHNSSTLAVLARDTIVDDVRELPVVGGTGTFRGATGYGLLRTHSFNATTKNAVLKIDMYLKLKV